MKLIQLVAAIITASTVSAAQPRFRIAYATYLGGSGEDDAIMGLRLDAAGNLYVAGHIQSTDFPVTPGAAQPKASGMSDCCLAKLAPDASRLLYATYLGGSGNEFAEHRPWLCVDGAMPLAGFCASPDFPTTAGALQRQPKGKSDGFLTKLAPDGRRLVFSTLLGGSASENLLMPTVDNAGNIYAVGSTGSRDLPVTPDALQPAFGGGEEDALLAILSPDASRLLYCTYLGGRGDEMIRSLALGPNGEVHLVGSTSSPDFPTTPRVLQPTFGGGGGDAFVVKLVLARW